MARWTRGVPRGASTPVLTREQTDTKVQWKFAAEASSVATDLKRSGVENELRRAANAVPGLARTAFPGPQCKASVYEHYAMKTIAAPIPFGAVSA
jgi:hypothetical protein